MQKDITNGIVTPGTYIVLKFDFSQVLRSPNLNETNEKLNGNITQSFEDFYTTYSTYLGENEEELYKNIVPGDPARSMVKCVKWIRNVLSKARKMVTNDLKG